MNLTELKKELYTDKTVANLNRVVEAVMYYTIISKFGCYEFPISTVTHVDCHEYNLSSDLGTTPFYPQMRASELIRWISKAHENNELIKLF